MRRLRCSADWIAARGEERTREQRVKSRLRDRYGRSLRATGTVQHLPDAAGVLAALQRIGYSLEASVADLIDNSIDASASTVLLRFPAHRGAAPQAADRRRRLWDDSAALGRGDDVRPSDRQGGDELGKYGMGLKSASFAQCESLTVVTRHRAQGGRPAVDGRGHSEGWLAERLDASDAAQLLDEDGARSPQGDMERSLSGIASTLSLSPQGVPMMCSARSSNALEQHLGLYFHRFLARTDVTILIDTLDVATGRIGRLHRCSRSTRSVTPAPVTARIPGPTRAA